MDSSLQKVLADVKRRIVPTPKERQFMTRLSQRLKGELEEILAARAIEADVSIQGSVARDTWLHEEHDLDIFARFPEKVDRGEWTGKFLPAVRKGFKRYRKVERYAEHPYLELWVDHDVRVNIVPCYAVEKGRWKSATDRSPYHTEYMQTHLTRELRDEARMLKKFMKGIRVYGAEIRIGGFSGMLVETLTLKFRSFVETLKQASQWKGSVFIDIENGSAHPRFESGFVVVDPVDPGRNLAAAVRPDKMWSFVVAAREFLKRPHLSFFYPTYPKPRTKNQFLRKLRGPRHDIVVVRFPHPRLVLDVLWGQLFSLERVLVRLAERTEFGVIRSEVWSNEDSLSAIIMEVDNAVLPPVQFHAGPPVSRAEESDTFLARHLGAPTTIKGPWLSQGRWVVEKRREVSTIEELLKRSLRDHKFGFTVPKQMEKSFRRGARVLVNKEAMSLLSEPGFGDALWEFLDGRPLWLRSVRS